MKTSIKARKIAIYSVFSNFYFIYCVVIIFTKIQGKNFVYFLTSYIPYGKLKLIIWGYYVDVITRLRRQQKQVIGVISNTSKTKN